ncbi:MAG: hypothetical protein U0572_02245 [Phycisphaerales bacterium]
MKMGVIAGAAALAVSGLASASFVGFEVDHSTSGGLEVYKVYAKFSSANDVVLNAFGTTNLAASNFNDADFVGGSWSPQFTQPGQEAVDSYVTIGGVPGFGNSTNADPGWGGAGFNQPGIPNGAGWFNSNPPNLQGKVGADNRTLLAQFVYLAGTGGLPQYTSALQVGYNQGLGTATVFGGGEFTIGVPGPGAVALLGLAGLAGRRRRA